MRVFWWIGSVFLLTFGLMLFCGPQFIYKYYFNGFYNGIRSIYGLTLYYMPFASIYLIVPVFIYMCVLLWKYANKKTWGRLRWVLVPLSILAFVYSWFYLGWGLLYKIPSLGERLNLPNTTIDSTYLISQLDWTEQRLLETRKKIWSNDTLALPIGSTPPNVSTIVQHEVADVLATWKMPCHRATRVRPLYPSGSLLVFSTAGIYLPFSGEGHYDPGLAHFHSPFVMAHELGHANGITGEADCNFVAMIACLRSEQPFIQYAGLLTYWRYLNSDLKRAAKYTYYQRSFLRPIPIRKDLEVLYAALDRYPEIMPMLRDKIYDTYLKANGLSDGLLNYDKILVMFKSWQESNLDPELKARWRI